MQSAPPSVSMGIRPKEWWESVEWDAKSLLREGIHHMQAADMLGGRGQGAVGRQSLVQARWSLDAGAVGCAVDKGDVEG
ncbi:hypothetical protein V6N12_062033 [Hibiscus sabdariffa]|uniref:Uncharacterized protein n=1 Tax=Hibiscus sabdariffa TaxID=183260 RepID=A0ABR2DYT0_9ROSI